MSLEATTTALSSVKELPWSTVIENGFNGNAVWLVPALLVLLQFVLKLFVGEPASWHQSWKNFLQSPVDTGFLALSFAATIVISKPGNVGGVFASALIFLLLLVISIVIWKVSPTHTTKTSLMASSALVILNYLITGAMLVYSVSLLTRG